MAGSSINKTIWAGVEKKWRLIKFKVKETGEAYKVIEKGESFKADIYHLRYGMINNQTAKTFPGSASGRKGQPQSIIIKPGIWGSSKLVKGPGGIKLPDMDFVYPTSDKPLNGKDTGAFKIGANKAKISPDPKNQHNALIKNYFDYWDHGKASGLPGYPKAKVRKPEKVGCEKPYKPGKMSKLYHELKSKPRSIINTKVDQIFHKETGIKGRLKPGDKQNIWKLLQRIYLKQNVQAISGYLIEGTFRDKHRN